MSEHPTRRNMLATIATGAVGASVAALPALAASRAADAPLLRLWEQYVGHARAHAAAEVAYRPAREAFDPAMPPFPSDVLPGHHWEAVQPLWRSYGLDDLTDAWQQASERARATIAAIQATAAE